MLPSQRSRVFRKNMETAEEYLVMFLADKIKKQIEIKRRVRDESGEYHFYCVLIDAAEMATFLGRYLPEKLAKSIGWRACYVAGGTLESYPSHAVWEFTPGDDRDDSYIEPATLAEGLQHAVDALGLEAA